jgi:hypothetical protein
MIEHRTDLWAAGATADAVVITTNGTITGRGLGVMGRGCALEAANRYNAQHTTPGRRPVTLQRRLGHYLTAYGNHVGVLVPPPPWTLVVFPVKHEWMELADLALIQQSAYELIALADRLEWRRVVLPRPGCGNGGLTWDQVQPLLWDLDDRFVVVTK